MLHSTDTAHAVAEVPVTSGASPEAQKAALAGGARSTHTDEVLGNIARNSNDDDVDRQTHVKPTVNASNVASVAPLDINTSSSSNATAVDTESARMDSGNSTRIVDNTLAADSTSPTSTIVNSQTPITSTTTARAPSSTETDADGELSAFSSLGRGDNTSGSNSNINISITHDYDATVNVDEILKKKSLLASNIAPSADNGADVRTEDGSADEESGVKTDNGEADEDNSPFTLHLVPFSDIPGRAPLGELIERQFNEGTSIRIGRQVIRDGLPVGKTKEGDIWFTSKVVSRVHCEMWCRDGTLYIKDIGSSSGTFLNKMRLSPSGKPSRPYPLRESDILQFGIDYKGKSDDVYKSITVKIEFSGKSESRFKPSNPTKFRAALHSLLAATNPFASNDQPSDSNVDCCICIGSIGPYQALFIAPCSHCYHYKCVHTLLVQSLMFQCPMCRQVANLTASVSMESLSGEETLCRNRDANVLRVHNE